MSARSSVLLALLIPVAACASQVDVDRLLVYVPSDVPAGSFVASLLRSTPAAGFHVYGVRRLTPEQLAERQACIDGLGDAPPPSTIYDRCGGRTDVDDLVPLPDDL